MFRVALIKTEGGSEGENFPTLEACYEFLLAHDYKKYRILDKSKNVIIETEKGKIISK